MEDQKEKKFSLKSLFNIKSMTVTGLIALVSVLGYFFVTKDAFAVFKDELFKRNAAQDIKIVKLEERDKFYHEAIHEIKQMKKDLRKEFTEGQAELRKNQILILSKLK